MGGPFGRRVIAMFVSPVGVFVLGALDSTVFFSLPFGIDAAVAALAARLDGLVWTVPLLATSGSVVGAGFTFWMGRKIGADGLHQYLQPRRLSVVRRRVQRSGAVALAALDLVPPPFPFTPFVLVAGALDVNAPRFFTMLAGCRLVRFGLEAFLAARYGSGILRRLNAPIFHEIAMGLVVIALLLTVLSIVRLMRGLRRPYRRAV